MRLVHTGSVQQNVLQRPTGDDTGDAGTGFEVTMATFSPTSRFVRLDLPTFGRPMTATNTEDVS